MHLIDTIDTNAGTLLSYGIVRYGNTLEYTEKSVYAHVLYMYYKDKLPDRIKWCIEELIDNDEFSVCDDDEIFASDGTFDPELNVDELIEGWGNDMSIFGLCLDVYRTSLAAKNLNMLLGCIETTIRDYNRINEGVTVFEKKYGKDATFGISTTMLIDYRDNEKSAYEIELLKASLAIKSMQGRAKLCQTNKAAIVMRMVGARTNKSLVKNGVKYLDNILKDKLKDKSNKRIFEKYSKRYHMDKLIKDLKYRGFIKSTLPHNRSLFLSTSLSIGDLAKEAADLVMNKEKQHKLKAMKAEEDKAKKLFNQLIGK